MLKVKTFIAKWLYKITRDKKWVRLYKILIDEQIEKEIEEVYHELNNC